MATTNATGGGHGARDAKRAAQRAAAAAPEVPSPDSRTRTRGTPRPRGRPRLKDGELRTRLWPLSRLVQYDRNPRRNDDQVDKMVASIKEFGFRIPIVAAADGTIVDGHLRYKAARKMRLAEVPVVLADGLTDAQLRAFRLMANKSAEWASWDDDLLRDEMTELRDDDKYDPKQAGFTQAEIDRIFGNVDEPEPEPEPATSKTVTCPGCGHEFTP